MSRPLVLVLGASGLLGSHVVRELNCPHMSPTRGDLDLTDIYAVQAYIKKNKPDIVVNCACVRDPHSLQSRVINRFLPSVKSSAYWIQVSSDAVFPSTMLRMEYIEGDEPHPETIYGQDKLGGEIGDVIIRTSIVGVSPKKDNYLDKRAKGPVQGNTNKRFSGVSATTLARLIRDMCKDTSRYRGVFHLCSKDVSELELLTHCRDLGLIDGPVQPYHGPHHGRVLRSKHLDEVDLLESLTEEADAWTS